MADVDEGDEGEEGDEISPQKRRGMRTGFTTGACATASAKAATQALLLDRPIQQVTIHLPAGRDATFELHSCDMGQGSTTCSVIKDAGDDPDVTHGAEICATVRWSDHPGIELRGGAGVGTVTRPGLGLEIGGPAINAVPRQMIIEHVGSVAGALLGSRGLVVEIAVTGGEEIAKKTLNGRLGIVGGISILGTTGIVHPWSTAAWRASVEQAIDVAVAQGERHLVLTTGGRSERFAMSTLPDLAEVAFVEMGIFTGNALKRCLRRDVRKATLAGMIGKFAKLAQGHFQTHVAGNQVDLNFLANLAVQSGADPELESEVRGANSARHVQELARVAGLDRFFQLVAEAVADRSFAFVGGKLAVETILFDFDGAILGRAARV